SRNSQLATATSYCCPNASCFWKPFADISNHLLRNNALDDGSELREDVRELRLVVSEVHQRVSVRRLVAFAFWRQEADALRDEANRELPERLKPASVRHRVYQQHSFRRASLAVLLKQALCPRRLVA